MLSDREVSFLLDDLCSSLGICLPPDRRAVLILGAGAIESTLADEIVRAEGLDPHTMDQSLLRQVRAKVAAAVGGHRDHDA
jgi:hypothetical protein